MSRRAFDYRVSGILTCGKWEARARAPSADQKETFVTTMS